MTAGPAIYAALGALGHGIEATPEPQRATAIEARLAKLDGIKWERTAWVGVARKMTPKGRITLGGSKEVAYAVYAALNDRTSPGWGQVRQ